MWRPTGDEIKNWHYERKATTDFTAICAVPCEIPRHVLPKQADGFVYMNKACPVRGSALFIVLNILA